MSKKIFSNFKTAARAALEGKDKSYIPQSLELKQSVAWQSLTIHEIRIIERLEIEHLRHGGKNNGNLGVAWQQFEECGVQRKIIASAINRLDAVGLLEVTREGTGGEGAAHVARYRLTYLVARAFNEQTGEVYWTLPTDEWKRAPAVPKLRFPARENGKFKKQKPSGDVYHRVQG